MEMFPYEQTIFSKYQDKKYENYLKLILYYQKITI
jgi:hypothetical protein